MADCSFLLYKVVDAFIHQRLSDLAIFPWGWAQETLFEGKPKIQQTSLFFAPYRDNEAAVPTNFSKFASHKLI